MRWLFVLFLLCGVSVSAQAQYNGNVQFITNNHSPFAATTIVRTGFSDVACVNGVCLAPTNFGAVAIPQSTLFFGASNRQALQFRVREFIQVPNTTAIVTTDSYGNEIIINSGIHSGIVPRSRGQILFVK